MAEYKDPIPGWLSELPTGSQLFRRAWAEIKYTPAGEAEGKDISEDIGKYFLSLTYTDNLSEEADDLSLDLEDRALLWQSDWFPEGEGNKLDVKLHIYNMNALQTGEMTLDAGQFEIDEIEVNGYPSTVSIKANSIIGGSTLRGTRKNKTWEDISVWKCAADICEQNGLKLFWDCEENPNLDHVEQADESDLEFLLKICKDNGMSLKVSTMQVIIFDEAKYEAQKPALIVCKPGRDTEESTDTLAIRKLTDYRLTEKSRDTYWKCVVRYQKGEEKTVIEGEFAAPDKKEGRILYVHDQVEDEAEAQKLAKKKLREANKEATTGSFTFLGNPSVAAGQVAELKGFGKFDGKYLLTKVEHELGDGYKTSFDVRRCLDGY